MKIKLFVLLSILFFTATIRGFGQDSGQNFVQDFKINHQNGMIQFKLSALEKFEYEVQPFDSRAYVLVRLFPLQFRKEEKKKLLTPLKTLPFKVHAINLMDQSIMLTFKEIRLNQLKLGQANDLQSVTITVFPDVSALPEKKNNPVLKSAADYYQTALAYFEKCQYTEAITEIHKALRIRPNYGDAYFLAGKIRLKRNEFQSAQINFKKALKLNPNLNHIDYFLTKIDSISHPEKYHQTVQHVAVDSTQVLTETRTDSVSSDSLSSMLFKQKQDKPESKSEVPAPVQNQTNNSSVKKEGLPEFTTYSFTKRVVQKILFFLILGCVILWGLLLWGNRSRINISNKKFKNELDQIMNRVKQDPQLTKINNSDENKDTVKTYDTRWNGESLNTTDGIKSAQNYSKKIESIEMEEPVINQNLQRGYFSYEKSEKENLEDKAIYYASLGYSVEEIARLMQLGKGEVQLMLHLQGQHIPMHAPEIRIQMD